MVFRSTQEKKILAIFDSFQTRADKSETGKKCLVSLPTFSPPQWFKRDSYDQGKQFLRLVFFLL